MRQFMRRHLLTIGLTSGLVLLFVAGISSVTALEQIPEATASVEHAYGILAQLDDIGSTIDQVVTTARVFVLTATEEFVEPLDGLYGQIADDLQNLEQLVQDDSAQLQQLDELVLRVERRLAMSREYIGIRRENTLSQTVELIPEGGERLVNEIRALIANMADAQNESLAERQAEAQDINTAALTTIAGSGLASLVVLGLTFVALKRQMSERTRVENSLVTSENRFRQAQKLEAVSRLACGVAHDFNNILTVVAGHSALIANALPKDSPSQPGLAAIARAAERGSQLTRQLLALGRKQPFEIRVMNPNDLLAELEVMLQRTIGENIRLETHLNASWAVKIDRAQLEQVVLNLAVNARDAMPRGGTLRIETSDLVYEGGEPTCGFGMHRRAEFVENGNYVRLTVRDTGVGMSEETLSHVFEPFYTTKDRSKGSGLGLPAVCGALQQCGGSVVVESTEGEGTCFCVLIPGTDEAPERIETVPESRKTSGRGTILVVEDDEEILRLVTFILRNGGYTVLPATRGQAALDEYSGRSVDLILTDVVMPQMAGPDFAREWNERNRATNVVYMSGYIDESLKHYSIPQSDIVTKPFTPAELLGRLSQQLPKEPRSDAAIAS